jgi:hypothetical protein
MSHLPISRRNPLYVMYTMSLANFFKNNQITKLLYNTDQYNEYRHRHSIFIFNSIPLHFIIALFRLNKIFLSQGSKPKRSLLSIVHFRLAQFLTCLEGIDKIQY